MVFLEETDLNNQRATPIRERVERRPSRNNQVKKTLGPLEDVDQRLSGTSDKVSIFRAAFHHLDQK